MNQKLPLEATASQSARNTPTADACAFERDHAVTFVFGCAPIQQGDDGMADDGKQDQHRNGDMEQEHHRRQYPHGLPGHAFELIMIDISHGMAIEKSGQRQSGHHHPQTFFTE